MSLGAVVLASLVWLAALFWVAYSAERGHIPERLTQHPLVYALSLGVYATSWSYFGSVGYAAQHGFRYLAIYLGITLSAILAPVLWRPILRLTRERQLTSLADLFAYRFPGQATGTVVTLFLLAGSLPYLALQIRAVADSARVIAPGLSPWLSGLGYCAVLIVFSILFGARHVTARERHDGLVLAIAFESVIKVAAIAAVGVFALVKVFGGLEGLDAWLADRPEILARMAEAPRETAWFPLLVLSFAAAFLLPRQFHLAFTESPEKDALGTASWAFPLLMLVMNLAIPPILWAGMRVLPDGAAELYTLTVPASQGASALAVAAFVGGISASSAMVIVTSLALAPMGLTYLVLPLGFARARRDLYRSVLWARRALIAVVVLAGYGFFSLLDRRAGLVDIGLVSFVAVAQFLPGIAGVLFWGRATRAGFLTGLSAGIFVWAAALIYPLIAHTGGAPWTAAAGQVLGFEATEPWGFVTFTSLTLNGLLFFAVSLLTEQSPAEVEAARVCLRQAPLAQAGVVAATTPEEFVAALTPLLGPEVARAEVDRARESLGLRADEHRAAELSLLRDTIERNLSGLLGPVLARMVVEEGLRLDPGGRTALADQIRFLEARLAQVGASDQASATLRDLEEVRRYLNRILQELPLGVCALGPDDDVVIWNGAMEELSGLRSERVEGLRLRQVPPPWGELLTRLSQAQSDAHGEVQVLIDGKERVLGLHRTALADGGRGPGTVLLVEDLTERKAVAARLAHQDRLASLGRVAAGVAHEIGNPLTGIASLAQNLKHETDPEAIRERLELVLQQTKRIDAIVRALISFSHAGVAVRSDQGFARVDVRGLADEAIAVATLGRKKSVPACANQCPAGVEVIGDGQRLVQVLVNLLTNAFDATGGRGRVELLADVEDERVHLRVRDDGPGIPSDVQARIFEPFFTTKAPGEGTGLGLSLVAGIVREHGGAVSLDSRVGAGTTVTVTLPRALDPAAAREGHA